MSLTILNSIYCLLKKVLQEIKNTNSNSIVLKDAFNQPF